MDETALREEVRRRYAVSATSVEGGCCGESCDVTGGQYPEDELHSLPTEVSQASLGCGNPTAVAELREGEIVLDLGSGGGIDVILSARRVGPSGHVYGLDMTDEMLDLARRNAVEAGVGNVEFKKGFIEEVPLPDSSVDVVISNCVVNLSVDKPAVFAEMYRVLRPGGRIGITDIVAEDRLTPGERAERGDWVGCIAGALSVSEYEDGLRKAGFTSVGLVPTHSVAEGMHSMIIRAEKPAQS